MSRLTKGQMLLVWAVLLAMAVYRGWQVDNDADTNELIRHAMLALAYLIGANTMLVIYAVIREARKP